MYEISRRLAALLWFSRAFLREAHIDQVRDATVEKEEVLAYRHVFASMLKRTLCWKQAESVSVKVQYSIAIRQIAQSLLVAFRC